MAEATLKGQVHELDSQVNQSILDTLERERSIESKLEAKVENIEKRVPTLSELSALKQKTGSKGAGDGEAAVAKESVRTESDPDGYRDAMQALEKAMQARVNALGQELRGELLLLGQELRGELQKQSSDLKDSMEASQMKADGGMGVLRNELQEQAKRVRYVDKISRTSAAFVLKYLPDGGDHKELEILLADGLLEGKIEKDLIDETADLRKQVGSLEEKLAKMLAASEAARLNADFAAQAAEAEAAERAAAAEAKARAEAEEAAATADKETEIQQLAGKLESLERQISTAVQEGISTLNNEFQIFKFETKTSLTHMQDDLENCQQQQEPGRRRKAGESEADGSSVRCVEGEDADDFEAFERSLTTVFRQEIEAVSERLRALETRISSMSDEEEEAGAGRTPGLKVLFSKLSAPACKALQAAGIVEVEQLALMSMGCDRMGPFDDEGLRGCGITSPIDLKVIETFLGVPLEGTTSRKLTLKGLSAAVNELRENLYQQIGHERDTRTELEHRCEERFTSTATRHDIALIADSAREAAEVSKKTQDEMVTLSMGLRVFMTETEEKLEGKADSKALLQKAGWSEVRDLMGELSAHLSEKLHHSSDQLKGLNSKIARLGGQDTSSAIKCISCSRPLPANSPKPLAHWSKNAEHHDFAETAHVQRIKTAGTLNSIQSCIASLVRHICLLCPYMLAFSVRMANVVKASHSIACISSHLQRHIFILRIKCLQ